MPHISDIRIYPVKSLQAVAVNSVLLEPWGLAGDRRWMVVDPAGHFITQRTLALMARIGARIEEEGLLLSVQGQPSLKIAPPGPEAETLAVTVWNSTLTARCAGIEPDDWLSAILQTPCRLVYMHDPMARPTSPSHSLPDDRVSFADGYPLLLATNASLAALNERLPYPVPMARFRPNLVVEGGTAFEEDRWRLIRVGDAIFRAVKPCARCVMTTIDQDIGARADGDARSEPLRTLAGYRRTADGAMFGINLIPEKASAAARPVVRISDTVEVLEHGAAPAFLRKPVAITSD